MAEKKYSTGNPSWLKWLVFAFVGFAVYQHFTGKTALPIAPSETTQAGLSVASQNAGAPPSIPDSRIRIGGDIKGSGDEAQCGQTATVRISGNLPDGKEYTGNAVTSEPLEVKVGASDETRPWVAGLVGMSSGGVREILVPASYVFSEDDMKKKGLGAQDQLRFRAQLDSLTPAADPTAIPLRVMDTLPGKGQMAYCGDKAEIGLVVWKQDGTVLFDSGKTTPQSIALGESTLFYGLDRALLGMREGGVRTAIIPPAYIASGNKNTVLDALPADQVAIVDISLSKITKPAHK